jgi:hypothetical protein
MAMSGQTRETIRRTRINKAIKILSTTRPDGFDLRDVAELSGHLAGTITVLDEWVERGELTTFRNENAVPCYLAVEA